MVLAPAMLSLPAKTTDVARSAWRGCVARRINSQETTHFLAVGSMSDAVALRAAAARHVANLRRIPQRVAQHAQFETTVNLLEADFRAYDQEAGDQNMHAPGVCEALPTAQCVSSGTPSVHS